MTNLFTNLSKNVLCTVNGPRMDRHNIENGPIHSRQLFAVLVMLLCLGVGNAWGALSSPYTCTFTAGMSMSGSNCTTGDVTWTVSTTTGAGSPGTEFGNQNGQSCIKLGSGKKNYYSKMTLTTSAFTSYNVSSVVIYASSNNGGSKTFKVTQGATQIGTGSQSFSSTTWVTNITRNTTAGSGGDLSIEISSDATATYVHSIKVTYSAASCTTKPTVGSSLTSVSATVNSITATVPISAIGGCNITENGLVYSTSNSTPTVGGTGCTKVTVTACGSTAANKTVTISDLTCGQSYYVRGYATNTAGTSYTNVTTQSTSACPLYTVTLMDDSDTRTQASYGASVTLPSRAGCSGYTFAGWSTTNNTVWTTTAPTIISAGSYTPTANINLYPVYTKTESGSGFSSYTKVTSAPSDWSGKYLISDGTSTATGEKFSSSALEITTLTPGTTEYTAYEFTITKNGDNDNYYIISPDGTYYVGYASSTNLQFSDNPNTNAYLWTCQTSDPMILNVATTTRYIGVGTESATDVFKAYSTAGTNAKCYLYKRIEGGSTTYYISVPNCCTPLGSINGSVSWSNDGTSLTVKNWGYTPANTGDESHISKYTVYLYSDADSYAASIDNEDCTVANRASTGVTFTGLNYARTYKVKITATPASGYCPVDDVWSSTTYKLTCATPTAATAGSFDRSTQKMPISWTSGAGKVDICYSSNSSTPAATPGSGYTVVSDQTSSPVNLDVSGLAAGNYYCWVRSVCDASNKSSWTAITGSTFTIPAHTLTITKDGGGTSTITPASGSSVVEGRTASITASPATGFAFDHWAVSGTNASLSSTSTNPTTFTMGTANATVTGYFTCVPPVIGTDPADANYYIGDSPEALEVEATLASGTLTYLWKVSTDNGDNWSNADGTNNLATYSGASLSTASAGTIKFKCVVGNSEGGCSVESGVATITVSNASYFTNGATVFIQADSKDYSAWKDDACVKAWFNASDAGGAAQTTYWLFDATDTDAGKKLFAAVVPASGDLNQVTLQRFSSDCSSHWNNNGTLAQASSSGVNTFRSYGSADNNIAWNGSSTTLSLYGNQNSWASSLATFADQGSGVWTASFSNYAPDATSKDYKIKTSYNNGWIGNTGSNNNATLSGMIVGSTYNVTATLDVTDHSLVMSKEFVKGTVHFDLQDHGLAISDLENVAAGSKISAPSAPSATGYTFGGWYKEPACTNEWTFATDEVEETMTLYAKWTANVYTITKTFSNVTNASLPASFTYTGSTTTALNSTFAVDATNFFLPSSIAVTMGGTPLTVGTDYTYNNSTGAFTFDVTITGDIVITATATAKLMSIAITTAPTKTAYFAGETFSATGAVVTATMGDGTTKAVSGSATWTPTGALTAESGKTMTATYTEAGITKTATTTINVYAVTMQAKDESGDAIAVGGPGAPSRSVTSISPAADAGNYVFKQWTISGASLGSSATTKSNTISTPTDAVIVTAVYYKPRVIKWSVNNDDSYEEGTPTLAVAYNTAISAVPTAPDDDALNNCANKFMGWSTTNITKGSPVTAADDIAALGLFTNASGYTTKITAATTTFYAVFAEQTVTGDEGYYKVTSTGDITNDGRYLIVNETNGVVFDGSLSTLDAGNNVVSVTITSSSIAITKDNESKLADAEFTIDMTNKYVKSHSNKYIYQDTYSNAMSESTSASAVQSISIDVSGNFVVEGKGQNNTAPNDYVVLRFNSNTGASNYRFRFYKGTQQAIQLYKYDTGVTTENYVTQCADNKVRVTYDFNGGTGTACTEGVTTKGSYTVCSTVPAKDYYDFAGWDDGSGGDPIPAGKTNYNLQATTTFTAAWTPTNYTITYNLNGGTQQESPAPAESYTYESSAITLPTAPTYGHNRFDGWYANVGLTGDVQTTIAAGSNGNKEYWAKWTTRNEIKFYADDNLLATIYRTADENLQASVAGQGSKPSDPDAPSACSSKVFMGWTETWFNDETNTAPADLNDATGTRSGAKTYYAVWATRAGSPGSYTYSAYSTTCCGKSVEVDGGSPSNGTVTFDKSYAWTCKGDREIVMTITPAAGYQLHTFSVATGDGKVAAKSMSADVVLDNNSSAPQVITLTFAKDADGDYDVTATFTLMTVTSWAWTMNSAAIPDPLNLYVGQTARFDVAYTPAGVDNSKKTYTRNKDDKYINWSGAAQATYSTISGKASTGESTTEVTFTHADGPTKTVNVKVLALPLVHFKDLIHGESFSDVVATLSDNALVATKKTPTHDDLDEPGEGNSCEKTHLHLIGWIRSDYSKVANYMNGTGAAPMVSELTSAGTGYWFTPNADINVETYNGKTFYAVWAVEE